MIIPKRLALPGHPERLSFKNITFLDWTTPFGKAVFETIRPFQYKEPTVLEVAAKEWPAFVALLLLVPFCLILLFTLKSSPL